MSCNILFGPQRRMVEIPAPKSGMSFGLNRGVTTSELVSGGRAVYRTPLGYKTFDMTWDGGTENLGEFMDIFEGAYGEGPYYILDPRSKGQNLLPSRWASPWQLAHVANGWAQPIVMGQAGGTRTPEDREVVFKARANTTTYQADSPFSVLIPLTYGETFNVAAWGSATGGAVLFATPVVDESSLTPIAVPLNGTRTQDIVANFSSAQMFVKLHLYVPLGSTLTLRHIELRQVIEGEPVEPTWHMGRGIGAVQFSSDMQGTLVSNKVDRIGLSVGMTEVED